MFTAPLHLEPLPGKGLYRTTHDFAYEIGHEGSGLLIEVPAGFETDLATVPRILWPILSPYDPRYAAAAVIHDRLYKTPGFTRIVADAIFYEAARVLGTSRLRAGVMFIGMRIWNRWR